MLACELSGESLTREDAVVTPSGHICSKRLLLQKLSENGGIDPFVKDQSLNDDQLIVLKAASTAAAPRVTSFPKMLQTMQEEYDAVVLELMETRQVLQETRQELSQALYQNDAAVRVLARLSMERDAARQELIAQPTSAGASAGAASTSSSSKKRKMSSDNLLENDIPEADLQQMVEVWESLHTTRKARQKEAATKAPSADDLKSYTRLQDYSVVSSNGTDQPMALEGTRILTCSDTKWTVYDTATKEVVFQQEVVTTSSNNASSITALDLRGAHVVAGLANGDVHVWNETTLVTTFSTPSTVVDVRLHPDGTHIVVASSSGRITLARLQDGPVAVFVSDKQLSTGALHPDGLIYVAASTTGDLLLYDLKSKSLASTLTQTATNITSLAISNNGYHIAVTHADFNDNTSGIMDVWDLRKQKVLATVTTAQGAVGFDPAGKYLAYGCKEGISIVPVKEWNTVTATLEYESPPTALVWGEAWMAAASSDVGFFGISQQVV
jgi:pre-mRNA-processing factor 19